MNQWKGQDIREIVNDSEWQALRKSFIGTWKTQPKENVQKLKNYLSKSDHREMRYVRVFNYLTGSGFRLGLIGSIESANLLQEVKKVIEEYRK